MRAKLKVSLFPPDDETRNKGDDATRCNTMRRDAALLCNAGREGGANLSWEMLDWVKELSSGKQNLMAEGVTSSFGFVTVGKRYDTWGVPFVVV